jgi:hypothetical protein
MNYQVKLFHWPERGDHVIMIARGFVEIEGVQADVLQARGDDRSAFRL